MTSAGLTLLHAFQGVVARLARATLEEDDTGFDAVVDGALAELGRETGAERSYIFLVEGDLTSNTHEWCAEGVAPQRDGLQDLPTEAFETFFRPLRSGKPFYVHSVQELAEDDETKASLEAQGIRRLLAIPMIRGDVLEGFVGVDDPAADLSDVDLVEPLTLLADVLLAAFHHSKRERALRQERTWTRLLLDQTPTLLYSASLPSLRVDFVSESIRHVLGYEPASAFEPDFWVERLHPDERERVFSETPVLVAQGAFSREYRLQHADGSYRWMHDEVRVHPDERGGERIVGASFDITERRLEDSRRTARARQRELVARITQALARARPEERDPVLSRALMWVGRSSHAAEVELRLDDDDIADAKLVFRWRAEEAHRPARLHRVDGGVIVQGIVSASESTIPSSDAVRRRSVDLEVAHGRLTVVWMPRSLDLIDDAAVDELMPALVQAISPGLSRLRDEAALRRLHTASHERLVERQKTLRLAAELASSSSLEEVFEACKRWLPRIVAYHRVSLASFDEVSHTWTVRLLHHVGMPSGSWSASSFVVPDRELVTMPDSLWTGAAVKYALERKQALTTRERAIEDFSDWQHLAETEGYRQFVVQPLPGVLATLNLASRRFDSPTDDDLTTSAEIASLLASHLGVWAARKRLVDLNDDLERRVEERTTQLRASEERFSRLFERAPQAMLLVNHEGVIAGANVGCEALFGFDPGGLVGLPVDTLVPMAARDAHARLREAFARGETAGKAARRVFGALRRDGTVFDAEIGLVPVSDGDVIVGISDVTESRRAVAALRASVAEKEIMIKEIHHRVKNNLQIVSGLLQLQLSRVRDEVVGQQLRESVARIRSMAMVHESLYQEEALDRVDFGAYTARLVEGLRATLGPEVRVAVDCPERVHVGVDVAIPLGLILNELVTNALKYGGAKKSVDEWDIRVALESRSEGAGGAGLAVSVEDRGPGLPAGVTLDGRGTLGLRLVRALSEQIGASLRYDGAQGAKFVVERAGGAAA